jgi:hypothetical protein
MPCVADGSDGVMPNGLAAGGLGDRAFFLPFFLGAVSCAGSSVFHVTAPGLKVTPCGIYNATAASATSLTSGWSSVATASETKQLKKPYEGMRAFPIRVPREYCFVRRYAARRKACLLDLMRVHDDRVGHEWLRCTNTAPTGPTSARHRCGAFQL